MKKTLIILGVLAMLALVYYLTERYTTDSEEDDVVHDAPYEVIPDGGE